MSLGLSDLFPNAGIGLNNIGFFFGAGASKEAGYPLTDGLTMNVINNLNSREYKTLIRLLERERISYSADSGTPDIEVISDVINKHKNYYKSKEIDGLERTIRMGIVKELLSVKNPNLEYHVRFLKALKRMMSGRAESIWIFTTNYDLLFEMAAMDAEIAIYNGFEGILGRYFDIDRINLSHGKITNERKFEDYREPNIKLIKLHGSISWFKQGNKVYELCDQKSANEFRSMILPRKQKVIDTLEHPYDKLFRYAVHVLGDKCKYILSCGYSFRDQHINDQLIIPKLRESRINFTALCEYEPENIDQMKQFSSFNYIFKDKQYLKGTEIDNKSDLWKFSNFVELLASNAGI